MKDPTADIQTAESESELGRAGKSTGLWVLAGVIGVAVLAAGGYGAYRFAEHHMEGRNLLRAQQFAAAGDLRRAQLLLEQAVQVNARSVRAQRAFAEFLDATGSPIAYVRWRETAALAPENDEVQLRLAASALRARENDVARTALATVSAAGNDTVAYHRAAAGLALAEGAWEELEAHYAALVRLEPGDERFRFNLAARRLRSGDRTIKDQARRELDRLARGTKARIRAVLELIGDAPQRWPAAADPVAQLAEHILLPSDSLTLGPAQYPAVGPPQLVAHMMAQPDPGAQDVAVLAAWLTARGQATTVLPWLDTLAPAVRADRFVLTVEADAAAQAGRWERLQSCLSRGAWGAAPPDLLQTVFALHARPPAGRKPGDWNALLERAQGSRSSLQVLWRLAQIWQWTQEGDRTLRAITRLYPEESWAWETLLARLLAARNTTEVWQLYERWTQAAPGDRQVLMERAILAGMLGGITPDLHKRVEQARAENPAEPGWAVAAALMLRQQQRGGEALAALATVTLPYATEPRFALVHGVLLSEAGRAAESEKLLAPVPTAGLLPEELAMLESARARNRGARAAR